MISENDLINSILLINLYLLNLELNSESCKKRKELTKMYLNSKISKVILEKNKAEISN